MAPEIKKIARDYVDRQVEHLGQKRVPKKSVTEAVQKVAQVLEEVRAARNRANLTQRTTPPPSRYLSRY